MTLDHLFFFFQLLQDFPWRHRREVQVKTTHFGAKRVLAFGNLLEGMSGVWCEDVIELS